MSFLRRLTNEERLLKEVPPLVRLHMRPNMLAGAGSKKKKTRLLYNESCNPSDLILLAMADEKGTCGKPFDPEHEVFLRERLEDYREIAARPRVTGKDLVANGVKPGPEMGEVLKRAELLHFSGMTRERALAQVLGEYKKLHAEE